MADLPITSFTSLKIASPNSKSVNNVQGGFYVAQMTTVQKNALINTQNGTIVYDTTVQSLSIYQNSAWININNTVQFDNVNSGGNANNIVNGQLAVFSTNKNGQLIMGAINPGESEAPIATAITVTSAQLKAIRNSIRLNKRKKNPAELPAVSGLTGTELIDFAEFGYITVNEQQFITLNLGAGSGLQNVLVTDDQNSSAPTSYNALLELRSTNGAFLLPRMSTEQMYALEQPIDGMMLYANDTNTYMIFCNGYWVNQSPIGNAQTFYSTSSTNTVYTDTLTFPTGVTRAKVTLVGGGGAGGTVGPSSGTSSGGGGGATTVVYLNDLAGATNFVIAVAGTITPTTANPLVNGYDTTFTYTPAGGQPITYTAHGGMAGQNVQELVTYGGAGGIASVPSITSYSFPGTDGGSCAYSADGSTFVSGAGGSSIFGGGAAAMASNSVTSTFGGNDGKINTGGGGSGGIGNSAVGGKGGSGICIIEY